MKLVDEEGRRYALPEVGEEPEYAAPTNAFRIEEIVLQRLHCLEQTVEGGSTLCTDAERRPLFTKDPVAGFRQLVDGRREIRCYGNLGMIANEEGEVTVIFGSTPLQEEATEKPCHDVSRVATPSSDEEEDRLARFCSR